MKLLLVWFALTSSSPVIDLNEASATADSLKGRAPGVVPGDSDAGSSSIAVDVVAPAANSNSDAASRNTDITSANLDEQASSRPRAAVSKVHVSIGSLVADMKNKKTEEAIADVCSQFKTMCECTQNLWSSDRKPDYGISLIAATSDPNPVSQSSTPAAFSKSQKFEMGTSLGCGWCDGSCVSGSVVGPTQQFTMPPTVHSTRSFNRINPFDPVIQPTGYAVGKNTSSVAAFQACKTWKFWGCECPHAPAVDACLMKAVKADDYEPAPPDRSMENDLRLTASKEDNVTYALPHIDGRKADEALVRWRHNTSIVNMNMSLTEMPPSHNKAQPPDDTSRAHGFNASNASATWDVHNNKGQASTFGSLKFLQRPCAAIMPTRPFYEPTSLMMTGPTSAFSTNVSMAASQPYFDFGPTMPFYSLAGMKFDGAFM